jgi:hypothetical protein
MLDTVFGQMVNGVVSLASLAFSSFKGNDVEITTPSISQSRNQIVIESTLQHGFDNDFNEIFRSGKEIEVWFVLSVERNNRKLFDKYLLHKVKYNPMTRDFHVVLQDQNVSFDTNNYGELIRTVSHFRYTWNWREIALPGQTVKVRVSSHMKTIKLDAYRKDFDLMMLWKFKKPHSEHTFRINPYET